MLNAYLYLQELRYQDKIQLTHDFSGAQSVADRYLPSLMMALVMEGVLECLLQTGRRDLQVFIRLEAKENALDLLLESNAHPLLASTYGAVPTYRTGVPDWKTQLDCMNLLDDCPVHYLESFSPPGSGLTKYALTLSLKLM